jgi:hypothetical protein
MVEIVRSLPLGARPPRASEWWACWDGVPEPLSPKTRAEK